MKTAFKRLIALLIVMTALCFSGCASETGKADSGNASNGNGNSAFDINTLTEGDATLKIMTWNIYLGKGNGEDAIAVVESHDPDILQFQEAVGFYETFVDVFLSRHDEYAITNTVVDGDKVASTPILYKKAKFDLVENGIVFLTDAYQANNSKTMSWAVFTDKASGKTFIDFDFHGAICKPTYEGYTNLSTQQANEVAYEWRRRNVLQILAKREELAKIYGDAPTFITGDCNFDSSSAAYAELMDAGYQDAEVTAIFSRTEDGYKSTHGLGDGSPYVGLTIDHVFGNGKVYFLTHLIDKSEKTITSSDHFPVIATAYIDF